MDCGNGSSHQKPKMRQARNTVCDLRARSECIRGRDERSCVRRTERCGRAQRPLGHCGHMRHFLPAHDPPSPHGPGFHLLREVIDMENARSSRRRAIARRRAHSHSATAHCCPYSTSR